LCGGKNGQVSFFARQIIGVGLVAFIVSISRDSVAKIVDHHAHRSQYSALRAQAGDFSSTDSQGRLPPNREPQILERGPENCNRTVCIDVN
jgi:hypothetical protein